MTVIIDFDDTLVDLLPVWVEMLNAKHRLNVDYTKITEWDMRKAFPELTREQIDAPLLDPILWSNVKPKLDCKKYLSKLKDIGYDYYVCTSTHPGNLTTKWEHCIKPNFPELDYTKLIITHNKDIVDGDVIIDDGLHNMNRKRKLNLCIKTSYNSNYLDKYDWVTPVKDWEEIYNELEKMSKQKT